MRWQGWQSLLPRMLVPISQTDSGFQKQADFSPIREPGPHLPEACYSSSATVLDFFRLFCDDEVLERIVTATLAYAEQKKDEKRSLYCRFLAKPLTKEEMICFISSLLLLSLNGVQGYRQAWDKNSSQFMIRLLDFMTRNRFEVIGSFLRLVTLAEELELASHPLRKFLPLHSYVKEKCLELYQPLQELSVDERMVKSKAQTHFRQYIRNKPTKWGFKYRVISDLTGYTKDFNIYYGAAEMASDKELAYNVVTELSKAFWYQRYQLYCDNFYTSPVLFRDLERVSIYSTGTLWVDRIGTPPIVQQMKKVLNMTGVPRGTGHYFREEESSVVYCGWRDSSCVVLMSTVHLGHEEGTARRRVKNASGSQMIDVAIPALIKNYNQFMGGVDRSDHVMSYHHIPRQTICYWKTPFYHLIEIMTTNAFTLYNWVRLEEGRKRSHF